MRMKYCSTERRWWRWLRDLSSLIIHVFSPGSSGSIAPWSRAQSHTASGLRVTQCHGATCPRVLQCAEWSPVTCYTCPPVCRVVPCPLLQSPGPAMFRSSASQENISVVKTLSAGKIKLLPELLRRNNFLFTRKYWKFCCCVCGRIYTQVPFFW